MSKSKNTNSVSWKRSVKTKLIAIMILVAGIPIGIALLISFISSTSKAKADAQDSLEWQAWYMEDLFAKMVDKNVIAMQTLATSPATINYLQDPDAGTIPDEVMLESLKKIDESLADGNGTILSGTEGMQILRTVGNPVDISDREYYKQAMAGTPIYVSDVQVSKSTGSRIITIVVPVFDNETGEILGCVQRNYDMTDLHDILAAEFEDAYVLDRTGKVAAHSQFVIGQDHDEIDMAGTKLMTENKEEGFYLDKGTYVAYVKEPNTTFTIAVQAKESEVLASAINAALMVVVVGVVMVIIAAVFAFVFAGSLTAPILAISSSLKALSTGSFVKVEKYDKRKDEFGDISKDANSVIDTISKIVGDIKESASTVQKSSIGLSDMADQMSHTADDVSNAVQEIASGASQQAEEIQNASTNVGHIGDAVAGVQTSADNLKTLADRMKQASQVSSESLSGLQTSSADMTEKIDDISQTIEATQDAVNHISEKVEGITAIATQTNLLSLNASIEAARAGEAGKGFSVVAEEIGKLAEDSKKMADDIRAEMEKLLGQSKAAVEAAKLVKDANLDQQTSLGETIDAIGGMIDDITKTVDGIQTISDGAEQCDTSKNAVVDVMSALSAISEENAASSEQTGASMQELSATVTTLAGSANDLKDVADKLSQEMEFFKE